MSKLSTFLALACVARRQDRGEDARDEKHRAATVIADQVQRHGRRRVGGTDRMQGAGQREIVEIVTGTLRKGAVLPPSRHPPIDQSGIGGETWLRTKPEPFHDARTKALEHRIRSGDQRERSVRVGGKVDFHRCAPAMEHGAAHIVPRFTAGSRPCDPDDVGTHIGEDHRRERHGPDRIEFHDTQPVQRTMREATVAQRFASGRMAPV